MREIKQYYRDSISGGKYIQGYSYYSLFGMRMQNSVYGNKVGFFHFIPTDPNQYRYNLYVKVNHEAFNNLIEMEFNKNGRYKIVYTL